MRIVTYFSANLFWSSFSAAEKKASISAAGGIFVTGFLLRRLAAGGFVAVEDSSSSVSAEISLDGVVSLLQRTNKGRELENEEPDMAPNIYRQTDSEMFTERT